MRILPVLALCLVATPALADPAVIEREQLQQQVLSLSQQVAALRQEIARLGPGPRFAPLRQLGADVDARVAGIGQAVDGAAPMGDPRWHHHEREMERRPDYVVVAPPPPPQPVPVRRRIMEPARFDGLRAAVNNEGFSEGKLQVVADAVGQWFFTTEQTAQLINQLAFSDDKIRALGLLAPRIADRENTFRLYSIFTFGEDKSRARRILESLPPLP